MKKTLILLALLAGLWQGAAGQVGSLYCDTLWTNVLPYYNGWFNFLCYNSDETKAIAGTQGGMIYTFDSKNGSLIDTLPAISIRSGLNPAYFYTYANINGKNLVCFPSADSIAIMNLDTKRIEKVFKDTILSKQNYGITAFKGVFNQNKHQLAIEFFNEKSSSDRSQDSFVVYFYDVITYELLSVKILGSAGYNVMEYSPDGSLFVGNSFVNREPPFWPQGKYVLNTFTVFETEKLNKVFSMQFDSSKYVSEMVISPNNQLLVTTNHLGDISGNSYSDEFIRLYDLSTKSLIKKLTTRTNELDYRVYSPAFTSNSNNIFSTIIVTDKYHKTFEHLAITNIMQGSSYYISDTLKLNSFNNINLNKSNTRLLGYASKGICLLDISNILSISPLAPEISILYPNPFTKEISITITNKDKIINSITIYDYSGKLLKSINLPELRIDDNSITFNCSDLPSGSFLLRLNFQTSAETFKIIKEK